MSVFAIALKGGTVEATWKGEETIVHFVEIGIEFAGRDDVVSCAEIRVPSEAAMDVIRAVLNRDAVQIGAAADLAEQHGDAAVQEAVLGVLQAIIMAPKATTPGARCASITKH